jgi:crotonobetainyl-CoA:carnitine CoA-transferase CaiB-like acyl-CoA transferase
MHSQTPASAADLLPGALDGVRVLDLSRVLAGPWCTQLLGDLGAEVIKVESLAGDDTRAWGPPFLGVPDQTTGNKAGESAYYLCANRNKRSIAIDFAKPEGVALVQELARKADIVVENFKVGGLVRFGLDAKSLLEINPRLVYCSITGFGQHGPYASRAGYDYVAQGMGGFMSINGQPDGEPGAEPIKAGVAICDLFTGLYAATSVLAALRHAERTGQGQQIDLALLDTQVAMLANHSLSYLVGGVVGTRLGNAHATVVPYRTFDAEDGALVIATGNQRQFAALCDVLGCPEIFSDERYATNVVRIRNRVSLEASLGEAVKKFKVAPLVEALCEAGVPAGPINAIDQVFADPQIEARGIVGRIERDNGVSVPTVNYPPHLSATPASYRRPAPLLGEHTGEVLREELGLDAARIAALKDAGVVMGRGI